MSVPTMALAMPPPGSPGAVGSWVKKSQLSELAPMRSEVDEDEGQRGDDEATRRGT